MSDHEEDINQEQPESQTGRPRHPVIYSMDVPLATTSEEILQDFPFKGTLLYYNEKRGHFAFYKKLDRQVRLSEMEKSSMYKAGEYRLMCQTQSGETKHVEFSLEEKEEDSKKNEAALKEDEIAKIRTETRNTVASEYESRINGYKGDLDDYARKWRDAITEVSTLRSQEFQERSKITEAAYQRERELLSEISDLKQQLAIAQLEAQYNGNDEDFKSKLLAMAGELAPNLLASITGQQTIQNPHQLPGEVDALNGELTDSEEFETTDEEMQETKSVHSQETYRAQFRKMLLQKAIVALKKENPDLKTFQQEIFGMVNQLSQANVAIEQGDWIQSINAISNFSLNNKVAPEKIATLIHPIVNHFTANAPIVRTLFNTMEAEQLVSQLISHYKITAPKPLQKLLVDVFTKLKSMD